MKNRIQIFTGAVLVFMLLSTSCEKWIDIDKNIDPNNPLDVAMAQILPAIQGTLAYGMGGDNCYPHTIWMQYYAGESNQGLNYSRYNLTAGDVDNAWNSVYEGVMMDCKMMMDKAKATNSVHYLAAGEVLMAYTLLHTTDVWGDVPYTEAFKGADNLHPAYDSQEAIYSTVRALLDSSLVHFSQTNQGFALANDMIYGGNTASWTDFVHAVKTRYFMHRMHVDGVATAAQNVIDEIAQITAYADFEFVFGTSETNANPVYQFLSQRPGYFHMGEKIIEMLKATNDPRLPVYAETNSVGEYMGSPAGNPIADFSLPGLYFSSPESPVNMLSYVELLFLHAEAYFRLGNLPNAATAYNAAVAASLAKYGVTDAAWLAANAAETATTITLQKIMDGKYIGLFPQGETYTDYRRTGIGTFATYNNLPIPNRFPYPDNERSYNAEHVPQVSLESLLWWDRQ